MSSSRHWANIPYLDVLRPAPAWQTEYALLASYSADLVALAAALLALAGLDDDRGSGSKVDFANAVTHLADRVRLVVQSGRLMAPKKSRRILTILDRYVRDVSLDEAQASWHPKAALVKHVETEGQKTEWRLWIGSRNLTRDLAWDIGLTLVGRTEGAGPETAGIVDLAVSLAEHGGLANASPRLVRQELSKVRWTVPAGCSVHALRLLGPETPRGLPQPPDDLDRLIVLSPFLDGTTVGALGAWGTPETRRILVSTRSELSKLEAQKGRPLDGFAEQLFLDAPVSDGLSEDAADESENVESQDEEPEPRSLHAKIILAQAGARNLLWIGSANATQRGWDGPNNEVIAELEVAADHVKELENFLKDAKTIGPDDLVELEPVDDVEERLETARKEVSAAWDVRQELTDLIPRLVAAADPNPTDGEIRLSVGLLGAEGVDWLRELTSLNLPAITAADVTELVWCRLILKSESVRWLQRAPLEPAPTEERDRQALARYLSPRAFLEWIRSQLTQEFDSEGGGSWDEDEAPAQRGGSGKDAPSWWAPTIEQVLRAWSRNPDSIRLLDQKIQHYLKLYQEQRDVETTDADHGLLDEFHRVWLIICRGLVEER